MSAHKTPTEFALIGHQESWQKVSNVLHALRREERGRLSQEEIRSIVPWIPPRPVVRIRLHSYPAGILVRGVYIDTFITPDELHPSYFKRNLEKVQAAAACAVREGAKIASLGGFTSIVLEGNHHLLPDYANTAFTTGNTLTVAYIVKGLEAAAGLYDLDLCECRLLVVGSTGDVGSGCINYFAGKTKELLLCARNARRLAAQQQRLQSLGVKSRLTTDPTAFLPEGDLVILAASSAQPTFSLERCPPHALICDAGFPKNARLPDERSLRERVFYGGMGYVLGGFAFTPNLVEAFYEYPLPNIGHGCMLEGALLALAERFEAYSQGRGNITADRIEEMWSLAQQQGILLAPFFNRKGLWKQQHSLFQA